MADPWVKSVIEHEWRGVRAELEAGGVSSAVARLWQLHHSNRDAWRGVRGSAEFRQLTPKQSALLDNLFFLSTLDSLEELARGIASIPSHLLHSFS